MTPLVDRFFSKVEKTDGCWIWNGSRDGKGYGMFYVGATVHTRRAHRVSYEMAKGPIPGDAIIMHSCDNPPCVNPDHLSPGTHAANARDRAAKGRSRPRRGANHGRAKLTAEQVAYIRQSDERTVDLARKFGMSWSAIGHIRSGYTWSNYEEEPGL